MKKILVFILIPVLLLVFQLNAQTTVSGEPILTLAPSIPPTVLDLATVRCQYRQTIVNDPANPKATTKVNTMLLQIGKKVSKYVDIQRIVSDSLLRAYEKQGMDKNTLVRKTLSSGKGAVSETIIKNYPENKITFTNYLMASYLYEEDYVSPQWKLKPDTMTVAGYLCKKAITTFRGRNYTAWYAVDIPISNGPWKFKGLPGLILKAEDDKNEISFECIAIEQVKWMGEIYMAHRKYVRTTKSAYEKVLRNFMDNPAAFIKPVLNADLPAKASKSRPYNPIELSE